VVIKAMEEVGGRNSEITQKIEKNTTKTLDLDCSTEAAAFSN
jgi:hypothetical protein